MSHQFVICCHYLLLSLATLVVCAFCVKTHLSFFAHLLVTCSQLCKMLTDSGWLCHHSVVKCLYRLSCNLYLSLSSRCRNTNITPPNVHQTYRCHKLWMHSWSLFTSKGVKMPNICWEMYFKNMSLVLCFSNTTSFFFLNIKWYYIFR